MTQEQITVALNKAFQLGQDYWRLADSDSYSDHRKASAIWTKFSELVNETIRESAVARCESRVREIEAAIAILKEKLE